MKLDVAVNLEPVAGDDFITRENSKRLLGKHVLYPTRFDDFSKPEWEEDGYVVSRNTDGTYNVATAGGDTVVLDEDDVRTGLSHYRHAEE